MSGNFTGYGMSGGMNPQPHPPPQFQQPSHPGGVRGSPSHPSQVRGSPSHQGQLANLRNSPSQVPGARNSPSQMSSSSHNDPDDQQKLRFQIEMEFVQSLGNPNYLHFLAQRGYMKDPCFINYIKYLQYWKQPQYVKYLKYPVCLHFLELLQHQTFRREIVSGQCARFLDDQVILHWQHYTRKRAKLFAAVSSGSGPSSEPPSANSTNTQK